MTSRHDVNQPFCLNNFITKLTSVLAYNMAGPQRRNRNVVNIVPNNEVMTSFDIRNEEVWRLATLLPEISDTESALQWCARRRLIKNGMSCGVCQQQCKLHLYSHGVDGCRWACEGCGFRKSVREGSFFARSHLRLEQILIMIYCWCCDMPQSQMMRESKANEKTAVDWSNFMREECEKWIEGHSGEIGGMDDNGDPIVVEIDESKYFHRKFHRGQWREGHWVFGGIERESGRCFLVEVPNRRADTLAACIEQHILPGSHIVSDGWAAYANIERIQNGIYQHSVVVHQHNFVNPDDDSVHTQNIENLWMRAKRKLKRQFGTSRALFPSYLHEFVYRNCFRADDMHKSFLVTLGENYA